MQSQRSNLKIVHILSDGGKVSLEYKPAGIGLHETFIPKM